ncbi:hypothetical protein RvY_09698 [Ramazzottius varieornatus]|uniref:Uncharacterized protein n=1 Tax=Ramazzottius varieornatus TaxID=947166 RepID=A0A1D1VA99_RAMVA|nr:hypothetical protein RvY_09698 [Ramazzottius varieornatus]
MKPEEQCEQEQKICAGHRCAAYGVGQYGYFYSPYPIKKKTAVQHYTPCVKLLKTSKQALHNGPTAGKSLKVRPSCHA